MDRVDDFIRGKGSQGSFKGTGHFTIDLDRAARLRSEYTFPRPEMWVLKFLQFLTRMNAARLHLVETKNTLEFRAVFEEAVFREYGLDVLFNLVAEADESDPRYPLREALWGAISCSESVTIVWSQHDQCQRLTFEGESVEGEVQSTAWDERELLLRITRGKLTSAMKSLFGVNIFKAEVEEVRNSGRTLAYAVTWNESHWNVSDYWPIVNEKLLEFRCEEAYAGPRFRLTQAHPFASYKHKLDESLFSPGKDYSYLVALSASRRSWRKAKVTWVVDGVPVAEEFLTESECFIGFHLFLSADGLSTDLSGLSLRQSPDKAGRLQKVCHRALRDVATHLPLGLISTVDSRKNRRLTLLSIPEHLRHLIEGAIGTIGVYGGREYKILDDLESCVSRSESRLKSQLLIQDKWQRMDLQELRDLADLIAP